MCSKIIFGSDLVSKTASEETSAPNTYRGSIARQHEIYDILTADDSGEGNRPCSPRPGNNSEPLCRPIQRYGSSRLIGIIQLVSGSGKGQNPYNLLYVMRDRSPNQSVFAPGIIFQDAQKSSRSCKHSYVSGASEGLHPNGAS